MSQRPDPNFIPKQETGPAGGFNHTKVCSSRLEIGTFSAAMVVDRSITSK